MTSLCDDGSNSQNTMLDSLLQYGLVHCKGCFWHQWVVVMVVIYMQS